MDVFVVVPLVSFVSFFVASTALPGIPLQLQFTRRTEHVQQTRANSKPQSIPDTVAAIMSAPSTSFTDYPDYKGRTRREHAGMSTLGSGSSTQETVLPQGHWNCTTLPILTRGDRMDDGGGGITITNGDTVWRAFFVYHNECDYIPWKYIWISPGATRFVSLPALFEGRIVRGSDEWNLDGIPRDLGTWFEFALDDNSWIWGDVSLIRGCDGAVLMWATDSSGAWKGFTQWILDGAPPGAYDTKPSGAVVLKATEGWDGSTDPVPRDWELQRVGAEYVYVDDGHGNPVITSTNGRFGTYWSPGRI